MQVNAQNIQTSRSNKNPFSLEEDLKFEQSIINTERTKLLKSITPMQLMPDLKGKNQELKIRAIQLMGYVADEKGRKEIEDLLLSDGSDEVRIACARALVVMRTPNSKYSLIKALKDRNEEVRIWSAITLSLIGEKIESFKFFANYYSNGYSIPYSSCHIGFLYIGTDATRNYLLRDTNNPNLNISVGAAIILAQLGFHSDAFPVLKNHLTNSDKYIRMAALRGLAYIGDSPSLQLVQFMINDEEPLVKERATSIVEKNK
jgi:HEAT repeat protein